MPRAAYMRRGLAGLRRWLSVADSKDGRHCRQEIDALLIANGPSFDFVLLRERFLFSPIFYSRPSADRRVHDVARAFPVAANVGMISQRRRRVGETCDRGGPPHRYTDCEAHAARYRSLYLQRSLLNAFSFGFFQTSSHTSACNYSCRSCCTLHGGRVQPQRVSASTTKDPSMPLRQI
ncbi:unnamed protein product [Peniophora sp. CBMAI 1063]|nr:unnamed protein product [Peniophora sp. CBMAI 1063]